MTVYQTVEKPPMCVQQFGTQGCALCAQRTCCQLFGCQRVANPLGTQTEVYVPSRGDVSMAP
jgi:hypothetical protein